MQNGGGYMDADDWDFIAEQIADEIQECKTRDEAIRIARKALSFNRKFKSPQDATPRPTIE